MTFFEEYQVVFWLAILGGGAWLATSGRPKIEGAMTRAVQSCVTSVPHGSPSEAGYVRVRFPVYAGAFVVVKELTPDIWVPQGEARKVVRELATISLKYGLPTIWAPYVLVMVAINYVSHMPKFHS